MPRGDEATFDAFMRGASPRLLSMAWFVDRFLGQRRGLGAGGARTHPRGMAKNPERAPCLELTLCPSSW